jgi:hypothetical protein
MHVPLPGSTMLLGLPDPSGSLPEGCVCVVSAAGDSLHAVAAEAQRAWAAEQAGGGGGAARGLEQAAGGPGGPPVLVYRNPGMLPSDVRRLALVAPPGALRAALGPRFSHGAFFSTRGDRCVAQLMAGGDYDGWAGGARARGPAGCSVASASLPACLPAWHPCQPGDPTPPPPPPPPPQRPVHGDLAARAGGGVHGEPASHLLP